MTAHFLGHLGGEIGTAIKHGQGHTENIQTGVQTLFHHAQRCHQVAETFQRIVFALDRDQNAVRSTKAVQSQQFQRRGTIDEDQIILIFHPMQGRTQTMVGIGNTQQFHTGAGKVCMAGQHIAELGAHNGVLNRYIIDDHIVSRMLDFSFVNAQAGRCVGLRVEIAEQDFQSKIMEGSRQIHCGSGFTHAAFLIDDSDYFTHFLPPYYLRWYYSRLVF